MITTCAVLASCGSCLGRLRLPGGGYVSEAAAMLKSATAFHTAAVNGAVHETGTTKP